MTAVERMVEYWNEFYKRGLNGEAIVEELLGPLKEIRLRRGKFATVYESVMDAIGDQVVYFPEAYFGFLNKDIRTDVLGLFMNPGMVHLATDKWNDEVVQQYTEWEPAKYLEECGALSEMSKVQSSRTCGCYIKDRHNEGCKWRRERYDELRGNFGLSDLRFLHSMELFPFHSPNFDDRIKDHIIRMVKQPFIQLTIRAVREISEQNRVRAIMGIGKAWEDVLDTMTWQSKTEETFEGSVRTRVICYQSKEQATPIVILSRQTNRGVKYVIPPEAVNYVCKIIRTQRQSEIVEVDRQLRPQLNNRTVFQVSSLSVESGQLVLLDEVTRRVITLLGDSDLYVGRYVDYNKAKFVYTHLWYRNRKPWHSEWCSFHIHVQRETQPSIKIRFGFNVNKLGWSQERVELMKINLSEISGPFGMTPIMGVAVFAIEREFDQVELAAASLAALIPVIQAVADEI